MAQGAAALLGILGALVALTVGAPLLPELQPTGRAALVAAVPPILLIGALVFWLGPLVRTRVALVALALAGAILTAATTALGAHGSGTVPELLLAVAVGLLFARVFDNGAFVIALPVLLGVIDLVTTVGGDAVRTWPMPVLGGDPLTLELPSWGVRTAAGQLSIATVALVAALQAYAVTGRLRPAGTALAMTVGLAGGYLLEWATGRAMPITALVAVAFLLSWVDLLPRWLRAGGVES